MVNDTTLLLDLDGVSVARVSASRRPFSVLRSVPQKSEMKEATFTLVRRWPSAWATATSMLSGFVVRSSAAALAQGVGDELRDDEDHGIGGLGWDRRL
ncbi:hypothetical protein [Streptomyces sp. NBC_00079]|uniref:hypothetical protein n=1 Tax=Streptomyces sp. NBC_00079 TaxID=2975644 RepID=UPI0038706515